MQKTLFEFSEWKGSIAKINNALDGINIRSDTQKRILVNFKIDQRKLSVIKAIKNKKKSKILRDGGDIGDVMKIYIHSLIEVAE